MWLINLWFFLWGLLWAVYFITDGFDLGVGTLLPFLGKDEQRKRIMFNATGPLWDGNEVWLIAAGGVTFAAFPRMYAVMFSALYMALLLLLLALVIRGVSFEYRSKAETDFGRRLCDWGQFLGSAATAVLLGVAFANLFRGMPIRDGVNQSGLFGLLNPYGLAGGVFFLAMFVMHGALWLCAKTGGQIHDSACTLARRMWPVLAAIAVLFLLYTAFATDLYRNYLRYPVLFLIPVVAVAGLVGIWWFHSRKAFWRAWFSSSVMIAFVAFFGLVGLFPNMLPSTEGPDHSVTAQNAASSPLTLKVMLGVVLLFLPFVIGYQVWAYLLFRDKVEEDVTKLTY